MLESTNSCLVKKILTKNTDKKTSNFMRTLREFEQVQCEIIALGSIHTMVFRFAIPAILNGNKSR